jgi:hypothetical protein
MIRKIILRVLLFIVFAAGSAFVVDKINNIGVNSVSREMEQSTLPMVYCYMDDKIINPMYGYTQVMSTSLMRDSVVPLGENHSVQVLVDETPGTTNSYSYELRSIAGDNLIEKGDIEKTELTIDGYRELDISFRMDMKENQEYTLVIISTEDDSSYVTGTDTDAEGNGTVESTDISETTATSKKVRYYTRVANLSENCAATLIDYAYDFHYTTFEKDVSEENTNIVYDALKTTGEGSDDDLSHVSLESSYDMVSWGGMNVVAVTSLIPTVVEVDSEYALVKFSYIAENLDEETTHYFNVEEYYDMHYDKNSGTIELLSFDRYQSSFFDASYINRSNNSIGMGIADTQDIEYKSAAENNKIAFVKEGELWIYDYNKATLTSVFSYLQSNFASANSGKRDFDINIDSIDDDGNIYFTVFGYISRGEHEGENGISLYYYTAEDSRISELFFISCDEPYDVMKEETGKFTYFDGGKNYYFLLDGYIYTVNLDDMQVRALSDQLESDKYIVSENRMIVAYPNNSQDADVTEIIIHNFETGNVYTRQAGTGNRLIALGFVENDVIYGEASALDIVVSSDGKPTMPMKTLYIIQPTGELIKQYDKSEIYIMDALVQEDKIYLKRAVKNNNFFSETDADYLTYKHTTDDTAIVVNETYDASEYTHRELLLPSTMYITDTSLPVMTKQKAYENFASMELSTTVAADRFYVFDSRGFNSECITAGQAIETVVENEAGLVIDSDGNVIYRNQDATTYNTVADLIKETDCDTLDKSLLTCAYMCIEYLDNRVTLDQVLAYGDYEAAFSELTTGRGINVSGISLSTALYFLDRNIPFTARIDDGRYVLVISYNSTHIRYFDPTANEEVKVTREEFEDLLSTFGNTIYTFAK